MLFFLNIDLLVYVLHDRFNVRDVTKINISNLI